MKIDIAIHSSDSNPFYLDFWPIVSKIWKLKFDIKPILVYIDEDHNIKIDETYGEVIKLKPVKGIPLYLQNLWVRYWIPSIYPDKVSVISDIDMLPISERYFVKQIEKIPADKYVHIDPQIESYGKLHSCYHIAKGSTFREILELHEKWEDSIKHLYDLNIGSYHAGSFGGGEAWFADEKYATKLIMQETNVDKLVFINRDREDNRRRIDRSYWRYNPRLLKIDYYFDSHSIRPYSEHAVEIDKLVDAILEQTNNGRFTKMFSHLIKHKVLLVWYIKTNLHVLNISARKIAKKALAKINVNFSATDNINNRN